MTTTTDPMLVQDGVNSLISLLEGLTNFGLVIVFVWLLVRGTVMLRKHHEDVVAEKERRHTEVQEQLAERLEELEADRDWWKDASVATLRIGQSLAEKSG